MRPGAKTEPASSFTVNNLVSEAVLHSGSHPVLGAVGVELQRVEALWRTGDLSFDVSSQQTVGHERTLAHRQDL